MTKFRLLALPAMLIAAPVSAAAVLDQNALNAPGFYGGYQVTSPPSSFGYREAGQIVTAGLTGTLSRIDLLIGGDRAYNVRLSIRSVVGGIVDPVNSTRLATFDLVSPFWGNVISYTVTQVDVSSANLFFTAGQTFAITLESLGGPSGNAGWAFADGVGYAGGAAQRRISPIGAWQAASGDMSFATYVDVAGAVPEPATWAMMIVGFGVVGGSLRRRRGQTRMVAA